MTIVLKFLEIRWNEDLFNKYKSIINLNSLSTDIDGLFYSCNQENPQVNIVAKWEKIYEVANLFVLASYLNHSDPPNVIVSEPQFNRQTVFITSRPIKKGEELTWKYFSHPDSNVVSKILYEDYFIGFPPEPPEET